MTGPTALAARATYTPILRRDSPPRAHMTRRQVEALRHAANGHTNAAIGRLMGISGNSVASTLRVVFRKLDAADRAHAVAIAIRLELIRPDDIRLPEALSARLSPAPAPSGPEPQLPAQSPRDGHTATQEAS